MPRKKPADYQRVRGSKACTFCSRRKIKCDGAEPCSVCQARKLECTYIQGKKRGPPSKLERQQHEQQHEEPPHDTHDASSSYAESSSSARSDVADNEQQLFIKRTRFDNDSIQTTALDDLATIAYESRSNTPGNGNGGGNDLTPFDDVNLAASAPSEQGSNSTRDSISHRELQSLLTLPSNSDAISSLPSIDQAETSAPRHKQTIPAYVSAVQIESPACELSGQVIDQLLTIYQSFVHLHWPIIYLPSLSSLDVLAKSHPRLYHAVLAVAASTQDNINPHNILSPNTSALFDEASCTTTSPSSYTRPPAVCPPGTAAKLVRYLKHQVQTNILAPTLETIQVLILLALVEMGGGDTSDAYLHSSMACVYAVDLGLHRQQSDPQSSRGYRLEERQRVLWGCYVLDKLLAAALERPMTLRSDDIDVALPSIEERDEYDIFVNDRSRQFIAPDRVSTMSDVKCRCISSFGAFCKLMVLLEKIIVQVYSPKAKRDRIEITHTASYTKSVLELDADLRSWRKQLPSHLQWSCEDGSELLASSISMINHSVQGTTGRSHPSKGIGFDSNVPPQVLTMRAWFSASMLLLHRPRLPLDSVPTSPHQNVQGDRANILAIPASDLVKAAATEICHLLPKYQSTFSVRRIPSSWVYLIFQSAVTLSSFLDSDGVSDSPATSNPNNESERLFRQCIRSLEQMALTWRGASHHVATLRRVVGCRVTRPSTPVLAPMMLSETPSGSALPQTDSIMLGQDAQMLDPALDSSAGMDWLGFWTQMPSSSEDVWLWQTFIDTFGNPVV
ncbi:uncharacterized protein UTRI_02258_B [Ustilago trichophora]|uniref:Zn(2)-C6 fungal-type domain-containing protein n=1 Tax=Ustilago trichophora TaxID=86804 RepID=A0A5C3DVG8_9BASI|nr:uncharacterized protein UTRI_02258_B [Ustilago trichophora]